MQLGLARLGVVPYGQALALQLQLRERLQQGESTPGWVLCLEHPSTVTLGKRGKDHDLVSPQFLQSKGVPVYRIDRGGEATYHGPGQLVIYPVLRLADLKLGVVDLIRGMAGCLSDALAEFGVGAAYDVEHPGVWTTQEPPQKIASVGMRVSGGVSIHGAAINVVNDMTPFQWIVPCGMPEAALVNLQTMSPETTLEDFREAFLGRFGEFLGVEWVDADVELPASEAWVPADL